MTLSPTPWACFVALPWRRCCNRTRGDARRPHRCGAATTTAHQRQRPALSRFQSWSRSSFYCLCACGDVPQSESGHRRSGGQDLEWVRPFLYAKLQVPPSGLLHVINVHLKSKISTNIPGQRIGQFTWKAISGIAEGYFISSMKRVGQALEARLYRSDLRRECDREHCDWPQLQFGPGRRAHEGDSRRCGRYRQRSAGQPGYGAL